MFQIVNVISLILMNVKYALQVMLLQKIDKYVQRQLSLIALNMMIK